MDVLRQIEIIPDLDNLNRHIALAKEFDATFEYNDFYIPSVLEDDKLTDHIIERYARVRTNFSNDTIHGAFLDVTIHSDDPLVREVSVLRVRQSMRIARRMGVRGVVFHTGRMAGFRQEYYDTIWLERNRQFFIELAEEYSEVEIYMENMFDEKPDILARLAEQMKHVRNFGVCFDYAHAAITNEPLCVWVKTLAPYIRHMHINDNNLKSDLHGIIGEGSIDWAECDKLLRQNHIEGSVLIEMRNVDAQRRSITFLRDHGYYPFCPAEK